MAKPRVQLMLVWTYTTMVRATTRAMEKRKYHQFKKLSSLPLPFSVLVSNWSAPKEMLQGRIPPAPMTMSPRPR